MFKDRRKAMVGTLVVAVFLSLLTFMTPGKALAAYECFICFSGIEGESPTKTPVCGRPIDVISWSFGETQMGSATAAGGGAAGKVNMQDFKFTMRTNKASPTLFQYCASGEHIPIAILIVRRGAAGPTLQVEYLKITLTNVLVSSFVNVGNSKSTEAYPMEEVSLKFGKIEIEYTETKVDGSPGPKTKGGWDVEHQKKI